MRPIHLLLLSALALLVACSGPKPLATPADISAADATGNLPALYNQARASLVGKDRNNKKHAALYAQLDAIGRTLASRLDADLRKQVEGARMKNGIVPQNVLADVQDAAEPMRTWEPVRHETLLRDLARDRTLTDKAVRDINTYIENLPATAIRKHMDALKQLALVTGDTRHSDQRDTMLQALRAEFEQARVTDDFETALRLLEELPKDDSTDLTRVELQTRLFERRFNESLADDRPDEAYALFDTIARSPTFADVKSRIGPTAYDMANYFVALGGKAVAEGNMPLAYRFFSQARDVHRKLDGRVDPIPEEKVFVDRLYRGHDQAKAQALWGIALGHLLLVQEFDPARPNLARDIRLAEEEVTKLAIRSATVAPFNNAAGSADYAGSIAARITEYLFQAIPNDVRIIAWDPARAAGIDYQVSGSVDEARVETSENTTRKTTRVVTEANALTRNPRYDEWLKLPERERRSVPQPAPQLSADRKEDVSYNVTQVRKVGYFSVAFRIVEAGTGKVMHTDSLTLKREFADEGNEGVELGQFRLPAKTPKVPTDIEILNQLALEASQETGKRLGTRLGDLEKRYAAVGKQAAGNGNPAESAQNYGMAVVVAQRKGQDAEALRRELKVQAVATGYAR